MILFLFLLAAVPYLVGSALVTILGDRRHTFHVRWIVGLLFLLLGFFACLLVALKLDLSLYGLCKLFGIFTVSFTTGSVPIWIHALKEGYFVWPEWEKKSFLWMIPAALLGVFSIVCLEPSYVNDITLETARTTLYTGTLYQTSALLGTTMEAGLPLFNKLEIVPMLYADLCRDFKFDVSALTGYIIPFVAYVSNLILMWEISGHLVKKEQRSLFMLFHLAILTAGTYLPDTAIPVTVGQPLLMQGYSGWALAYGIVIPAVVLMLLERRVILAGICFLPIIGLIRYDRVFFACKTFFTGYHLTNTAGKLLILYLVCLVLWILRKNKGMKNFAVLSGSALISTVLTEFYERLGNRKSFVVATMAVIFSCVYFQPFQDAEYVWNDDTLSYMEISEGVKDVTVWASQDVESSIRRQTAEIKCAYGRDLYEDLLDGVNYEPVTEDQKQLYYAMSILDIYVDEYVESIVIPIVEENQLLDEVDVVVLPMKSFSDKINTALVARGFTFCTETEDYLIMRRYE